MSRGLTISDFPNNIYKLLKSLEPDISETGGIKLKCPWCSNQSSLSDKHEFECKTCAIKYNVVTFVMKLAKKQDKLLYSVMNTCCFRPMKDDRESICFNNKYMIGRDYSKSRIMEVLKHKLLKKWYSNNRIIHCLFEYNPHTKQQFNDPITSELIYNIYVPPSWKAEFFYHNVNIIKQAAPPKIYEDFFKHLVGHKQDSYEYLLDWIATSARSRCQAYLILLGEEGVGKGVFGEILRALHGPSNFRSTGDKVLTSSFNDELKDRTMVYIDEISIVKDKKNKEAYNRFKALVNEWQEYEGKHRDRESGRSYASYYISANDKDAIPVTGDDRRYSFLSVSNTRLVDSGLFNGITIQQYADKLKNEENINELAQYLWHRTIKNDMSRPFTDVDQLESIKEAMATGWERWLIYQWAPENKGKVFSFKDIQTLIREQFPAHEPPGRPTFELMAKKHKGCIKIRQKQGSPAEREVVVC